ncbi:MAG TPA: GntR family transcriptional regulator [Pseudonocardia sp.]|nr:GntR family transcriptional regulator [Pseudonocardia sp.]
MPKVYGQKEKDSAITHVLDLMFTGRLRGGDRVDRNRIASELGISRVPIQEALVQLENDGVLSTRYHRGAFIERFDPDVVREHYEVFGVLSGMASSRAARDPSPRLLSELGLQLDLMRAAGDSEVFFEHTWEFRRIINHDYAGPRLRAAMRSSEGFMPRALWVGIRDNQPRMLPFYELEHRAIRRRDPDAARAACADRSAMMAEVLIAELVRRDVFARDDESATGAGS